MHDTYTARKTKDQDEPRNAAEYRGLEDGQIVIDRTSDILLWLTRWRFLGHRNRRDSVLFIAFVGLKKAVIY